MPSFSPEIGTGGAPGDVSFVPTAMCLPAPGSKRFYSAEIKEQLTGAAPGSFVLLEEQFAHIGYGITSAHFNEIAGFEQTREESYWGVRFGELILHTLGDREQAAHVAAKPFDLPADAASDAGAMMALNNLSDDLARPLSYKPLGFWRESSGNTFVVTEYDPTVTTQDNVFWRGHPPAYEEAEPALLDGALSLGGLHYHGFSHGDAQVKNIAADFKGVRYVDLESMRHLNSRAAEQIRDDLKAYLGALTAKPAGYVPPSHYDEIIGDVFVPTYRDTVAAEGSKVPETARLNPTEIAELANAYI